MKFSIGNFNTVLVLEKAASNNKNLKDISFQYNKLQIKKLKGLSLAMIALIIVAMGLTEVGGVYAGGKNYFSCILIGSIVRFCLYFQWTVREIASIICSQILYSDCRLFHTKKFGD